jgi:hypothetical protein
VKDVRRLRRERTIARADPEDGLLWKNQQGDGARARYLRQRAAVTEVAVRRALAAGSVRRAGLVAGRVVTKCRHPAHVEGEQCQENDEDGALHVNQYLTGRGQPGARCGPEFGQSLESRRSQAASVHVRRTNEERRTRKIERSAKLETLAVRFGSARAAPVARRRFATIGFGRADPIIE